MTIYPVPKPKPKVKAPKRIKAVNRARKSADDARVYGPTARRKLVSLGPCTCCGAVELCDNAHVLGNDGAGRKQGYRTIAALCRPHLRRGEMYEGCHAFSHRDPLGFKARFPKFNPAKAARFPKFNPAKAARLTERRWQTFLRSGGK